MVLIDFLKNDGQIDRGDVPMDVVEKMLEKISYLQIKTLFPILIYRMKYFNQEKDLFPLFFKKFSKSKELVRLYYLGYKNILPVEKEIKMVKERAKSSEIKRVVKDKKDSNRIKK